MKRAFTEIDWQDQITADQAVYAVHSAVEELERLSRDPRFASLIAKETISLRSDWIGLGNALSEITKRKLGEAA